MLMRLLSNAIARMVWRKTAGSITENGSVAKSGYLVTCLRDLPRGIEA